MVDKVNTLDLFNFTTDFDKAEAINYQIKSGLEDCVVFCR